MAGVGGEGEVKSDKHFLSFENIICSPTLTTFRIPSNSKNRKVF